MNAKEFLKNISRYCIPSVVSAVLGIIAIPIVSRLFPTDDYGKINLFYTIGNMLLYVVLLGLDSAYIRFYFETPKGITKKDLFSLSFWFGVLINFLATLVCIFFFSTKASLYLFGEKKVYLLMVLSVYVFALMVIRLLSIETRMEGKTFLYNLQQVSLIITNRVAYVGAVFVTTNYQFSILIIVGLTVILAFLFLIKQKKIQDFTLPHIPWGKFKFIMAFSIPLMPTTLMTWANNSAAKMVVSSYGDFAALGVLTIATGLANVFSLIPSAFCAYWSPFMYKNHKTNQSFIKQVHNYILLLSIVILLCFYCFQDIVYLLVGEDYKKSQDFFMLIMLSPIQSLLCETTGYGIIFSNKTKFNMYISIVSLVVNFVLGYTLYPVLGIHGVVLGIAISSVIILIIKTILGQHYYKSIVNKWQTICGYLIIIFLTTCNLWTYDKQSLKILITFVVLFVVILNFKNEILQCVRSAKKMLAKKGNQNV